MKKIYVYRNTTVEYLFSDDKLKYDFSSYGDISMPNQEYDAYLFFYMIPYKYDRENLILEIQSYLDKIKYLVKTKPNDNFFVMTLYSYFDNNFVYSDRSLENQINRFNEELYKLSNNIKVIEFENFLNDINTRSIMDMKYYYLYNAIINPKYKNNFPMFIDKEIQKYDKHRKKCLVLDLDNTLWSGIIGEDGIKNVKISGDYPGNSFCDFQKLVLSLKRNGIILCIASKNNKEDVDELFKIRNDMILKKEDFVIIKASWNQKNIMIKEIAKELNIGLSDIVFIDDDNFQRELIKRELPEVVVTDFPKWPYMMTQHFSKIFKELFSIEKLTDEDLNKTKQYKARIESEEMRNQFDNIDDFIESLNMEVNFESMNDSNITRIEELINKSNQFNVTTKRYNKSMLEKMKNNSLIYAMRVKDKFDDLGIVGISIVKLYEEYAEIDTFLLSCRVIGRKLEFQFLKYIFHELKEREYKIVKARYIKTPKNSLVQNFYLDAKFDIIEKNDTECLYQKEIN